MIISGIRTSQTEPGSLVEARVRFERPGAADEQVFVSSDGETPLTGDPNGLLLATFVPAWIAGERRLVIEGAVCPLLAANLRVAASILSGWYGGFPPLPEIDASLSYRTPAAGAAMFVSGGVDSLATMRNLTTVLPHGHPDRPTAAILIDYQDVRNVTHEETEARFAARRRSCGAVCADAGLRLITIRTNLRRLGGGMGVWMTRYHGSFLAAMGHMLSDTFCTMYVAASRDALHLGPWGSHPLLDPFFSSRHVRISHHGIEFSRLRKVGLLKDWPAALDAVNVCVSPESRGRNCGRCEKCMRTKLHMLVEGCLANAGAFAEKDVSPADLAGVRIKSEVAYENWMDAMPGLRALGRLDLTAVIDRKIQAYRRRRGALRLVGSVVSPVTFLARRCAALARSRR